MEAAHTYFVYFGLTQPHIEPMNFHTWGQHTYHYNNDVVKDHMEWV